MADQKESKARSQIRYQLWRPSLSCHQTKRVPLYMAGQFRSILRKLRKELLNTVRLVRNYWYDYQRFRRYASPFRDIKTPEQLQSYIIMLYHSIEKGLVLPRPKYLFGQTKIKELVKQVRIYLQHYGYHPQMNAAIGALKAYLAYHENTAISLQDLSEQVIELQALCDQKCTRGQEKGWGGTRMVTREEIWAASRLNLQNFFERRYSIRQFSEKPADPGLICKAIHMAQKAPSVCNRQASRVYVFENDSLGKLVLSCQTGNKGFGDKASKILIVTTELGAFLSVGERNQCWIDGGLFAMSLVYALHSLGLGTCCLNWSVEYSKDQQLRKVAGIRDSENIIMLLAVGHLPEQFQVAYSQRSPLEEIVVFKTSR